MAEDGGLAAGDVQQLDPRTARAAPAARRRGRRRQGRRRGAPAGTRPRDADQAVEVGQDRGKGSRTASRLMGPAYSAPPLPDPTPRRSRSRRRAYRGAVQFTKTEVIASLHVKLNRRRRCRPCFARICKVISSSTLYLAPSEELAHRPRAPPRRRVDDGPHRGGAPWRPRGWSSTAGSAARGWFAPTWAPRRPRSPSC